ncbi:VWA domain-containing protein [Bernardetia sp. OM2101]|uniref:vWA domain-containing protein n=1 Tax=Bernardetia sp. OM2101 TaxID=3344876 RepID=UPI0035CF648C
MKTIKISLLFLFILFPFLNGFAQNEKQSPIIFIYDASGSMWGQIKGKAKVTIATEVLSKSINQIPATQKVGLVAYGHRNKEDCQDVEFVVATEIENRESIQETLKKIKPLGRTPLAYSAQLVIDKIATSNEKATIILVTDGIESCDGDICKVVQDAKAKGIDFKLHIIGFGLKKEETKQLKCAAKSGDGRYYDAADAEELSEILQETTTSTVDKPKDNFSIYTTKNGQPVDAYLKAVDVKTKKSISVTRTYGDTSFFYLPEGEYDLHIQPLEGSKIAAIVLNNIKVSSSNTEITHKTVSFDGGNVEVNSYNNDEFWDTMVKVYDINTGKVAAHKRTYGRTVSLEVNAGNYYVEMQILTISGLETTYKSDTIEVKAKETTSVTHHFETGILKVGATSNNELIDALVTIKEVKTKKSVAGQRTYTSASSNPREFILNTGTYEITIKPVKIKGEAKVFTVTIEKGKVTEKSFSF